MHGFMNIKHIYIYKELKREHGCDKITVNDNKIFEALVQYDTRQIRLRSPPHNPTGLLTFNSKSTPDSDRTKVNKLHSKRTHKNQHNIPLCIELKL